MHIALVLTIAQAILRSQNLNFLLAIKKIYRNR